MNYGTGFINFLSRFKDKESYLQMYKKTDSVGGGSHYRSTKI